MTEPLRIAIVGHTNAGKTSLLRTLTRRVDFGAVSEQPGTTRHAEAVELRLDGRVAVRFIDTPGLEDSVALLDFLGQQGGPSRIERVRAFLAGPEALAAFEQEAKVLRVLTGEAEAAMLVIDVREPVLPKYLAEIEILAACARPIMPVLNFTRGAAARLAEWHQALQEGGLHARAEFDVVAPFHGSEQQLYADLASLLPQRRAQLATIASALAEQARHLQLAGARIVASALIDVAAMRRALPAAEFEDPARRQAFVQGFQGDVRRHAGRAANALVELFGFRVGDAELAELPELAGRWEDDLFNPELLRAAGQRLGLGALIGGAIGAVADLALAGLSLGAATATGAAVGGVFSGGWRALWRKLENRLQGVQELTVEAPLLLLLAQHLLALAIALAQRGHAAQQRLQVGAALEEGVAAEDLRAVVRDLGAARSHPGWERAGRAAAGDARRDQWQEALAQRLLPHLAAADDARADA